jgi:CRISPR/Cas system-associated protein endoribonuclease Cas2
VNYFEEQAVINITEKQFIVKFQIKFGRMKFSSVVCNSNKNKMKLIICMMCCMMPEISAETAIV